MEKRLLQSRLGSRAGLKSHGSEGQSRIRQRPTSHKYCPTRTQGFLILSFKVGLQIVKTYRCQLTPGWTVPKLEPPTP